MEFTFVVAGIFKNEAHILKEWILHYITMGVEHFYLVNDFSTDNFENVLKEFNCITLFHNDIVTKNQGRQTKLYDRYFKNINSMWVAILDLDEFLWSPKTKDIKQILNNYNEVAQLKIDWLHFGSSGFIKQPTSVVQSFTKRAHFDTSKEYYSFKSIYKPSMLRSFNVHGHSVNGKTIHLKYSEENVPELIINHYPLQSFTFFMNIKATRGDVDNWFDHTGRKRNEEYFKKQDINDVEDKRLMKVTSNV